MADVPANGPPLQQPGPAGRGAATNADILLPLRPALPPGAPLMAIPMPAVPQLPPQMFTTAAQLLDLTDSEWRRAYRSPTAGAAAFEEYAVNVPVEKLLAVLRDGRKYIGVLRSWDQFGIDAVPCF